jgi:hypothetical protein
MSLADRPRRRLHHLLRVIFPLAFVPLSIPATGALVEPSEREMRGAYLSFLKESLTAQGKFADPNCDLAVKGCSVVLLDMRRDYRLAGFKKRECRASGDTAFVCRFDANVSCAYLSAGKPNPVVADLYCGPLYNKTSVFTALFHYQAPGWVIQRFVSG